MRPCLGKWEGREGGRKGEEDEEDDDDDEEEEEEEEAAAAAFCNILTSTIYKSLV